MKRLLLCLSLCTPSLNAQNPAKPTAASTDLATQTAHLAEVAQQLKAEIDAMNKFELSVKAMRTATEVETLARTMRAQATPVQH